uniref:Uncharacterized protein n=1 Tax=Meloidogyne incognita TaxID=6306 RepID=A0A914LBV6_MELIC
MKEMEVYSKILLQTCIVDIIGIVLFVIVQPWYSQTLWNSNSISPSNNLTQENLNQLTLLPGLHAIEGGASPLAIALSIVSRTKRKG